MKIDRLSKENYENWRFGRIPYLEKVIIGNLSKANSVLKILKLYAEYFGLKPSKALYKKWGKGNKSTGFQFPSGSLTRFQKTGVKPWMA